MIAHHHPRRSGYTMVELLLAMGIGLMVLNGAFVAFVNTGRFFRRIESVAAKNAVAQSAILWSVAKSGLSQYPTGVSQYRRVGVGAVSSASTTYDKVTIGEIGAPSPVIRPIAIVLPKL